jgi:hypothetical protein
MSFSNQHPSLKQDVRDSIAPLVRVQKAGPVVISRESIHDALTDERIDNSQSCRNPHHRPECSEHYRAQSSNV